MTARPASVRLGAGSSSHSSSRAISRNQSVSQTSSRATTPDVANFVTGPPSRVHWRPDDEVTECQAPECEVVFGLLNRRHHCRRCGNIFCGEHSAKQARLDQNCNFNVRGVPCRVCDRCFDDFEKLLVPLKKPEFETEKENTDEQMELPLPQEALKTTISKAVEIHRNTNDSSLPIMSVPTDWQWSTF
ncbi:FYVE-domain-containing protein [Gonapodya prolifera JEL478]|uniref:FYVE-domain-containing protein n=1 Tax=Gonapodya prolifera (strain JEL478) TaxID=1344416 RepID=A0A139AD77_GONPJ|nr:FYVE-domain-containing protein [Gonapodya prolifera JEL478]|eukprot:KXS14395.1 FYVE-domain-containing protein [Gonapodya prolifera JEL478]